jgi:hypothetical protein
VLAEIRTFHLSAASVLSRWSRPRTRDPAKAAGTGFALTGVGIDAGSAGRPSWNPALGSGQTSTWWTGKPHFVSLGFLARGVFEYALSRTPCVW